MNLNTTTLALLILNTSTRSISNKTWSDPQMVNQSMVIEVMNSLCKLYDFKTFVFFVSERLASSEAGIAAIFFYEFRLAFPTAPVILVFNTPRKMSGFLSSSTLCLILTTEKDDPIMEVAALSMKGNRYIKTIFIVNPLPETSVLVNNLNIRSIYKWIWKKQFLNTILITIRNNIFIHEPYPAANILNKTYNWTAADFFEDYTRNLKGYKIQTVLHQDLPRLFIMARKQKNAKNVTVSGVSGKMFLAFLRFVNATFGSILKTDNNLDAFNVRELIQLVESKHVEMGMNTYTAMIPSLIGASYPIGINDFCIMVPQQNRSPDRVYIKGAFRSYSWYLLLFALFYITLGIWLCTPSRERDLSLAFLQSICSLVLTVPLRFLMQPHLRLRFLFVMLFLMGFFVTNMYVSKLASYFSSPTRQKQLDTVADVIEAQLPIMMMDYEYENLKEHNFPQKFLDLIIVASKSEVDKHRGHFNSSYGYSIQTDRWSFLNKQQMYLHKPLFRMSSICIGPYYHVFPIQQDSHLSKILHEFILIAYQSGFTIHWEAEAFLDALFMGYISIIMIELHPVPLTLIYFRPIMFVWCFGVTVATFSFAVELNFIKLSVIGNCVNKGVQRLRGKLV